MKKYMIYILGTWMPFCWRRQHLDNLHNQSMCKGFYKTSPCLLPTSWNTWLRRSPRIALPSTWVLVGTALASRAACGKGTICIHSFLIYNYYNFWRFGIHSSLYISIYLYISRNCLLYIYRRFVGNWATCWKVAQKILWFYIFKAGLETLLTKISCVVFEMFLNKCCCGTQSKATVVNKTANPNS